MIFRREFRQQMLLQKVHNYSRLAVFGLEEKILLHLQRSSAYTTIELTFLKSVSRWYLDYRKLVHHCTPMTATIVKKLNMLFGNSSVWLDNFLLEVQHFLKSRRGSYLVTDKLFAATIMRSLSHSSFDNNIALSCSMRIYIRLCSHSSCGVSVIISKFWMVFNFLFFQKTRPITNKLYFLFSISNVITCATVGTKMF